MRLLCTKVGRMHSMMQSMRKHVDVVMVLTMVVGLQGKININMHQLCSL